MACGVGVGLCPPARPAARGTPPVLCVWVPSGGLVLALPGAVLRNWWRAARTAGLGPGIAPRPRIMGGGTGHLQHWGLGHWR
eukprot:13738032-Alexandrium_andersonii.AAC.1